MDDHKGLVHALVETEVKASAAGKQETRRAHGLVEFQSEAVGQRTRIADGVSFSPSLKVGED